MANAIYYCAFPFRHRSFIEVEREIDDNRRVDSSGPIKYEFLTWIWNVDFPKIYFPGNRLSIIISRINFNLYELFLFEVLNFSFYLLLVAIIFTFSKDRPSSNALFAHQFDTTFQNFVSLTKFKFQANLSIKLKKKRRNIRGARAWQRAMPIM